MLKSDRFDSATITQPKLCYYCNQTPRVQVGLITNIPGQRVEQVLFPGQRWMFWASPDAVLALYDSDNLAQAQVEQISCRDLLVVEVGA